MFGVVASVVLATRAVTSTSFCDPDGSWHRLWEDEFDGPALDETKWTRQVGSQISCSHVHSVDCLDVQVNGSDPRWIGSCRHARCAEDDVYVENGSLVIRSQKRQSCFTGGADPGCFNYSTGGLTTQVRCSCALLQKHFQSSCQAALWTICRGNSMCEQPLDSVSASLRSSPVVAAVGRARGSGQHIG